jgi:arabinogalactan oligomer/maltooligosaccharide transport system permease protein
MLYVNHKKSAKGKRITGDVLGYIVLIIMSIFWIFPFFYMLMTSFNKNPGITLEIVPRPGEWTLDNYKYLFVTDKPGQAILYNFGQWYLNTLLIAVVVSVIQTIIVLLTAYAFSRMRFAARKPLMNFLLIIGMFPGFLSMVCIFYILKAINLSTSVWGLVLVYISGAMMGYYICKGFFDTISKSLDEAAMIDGASRNTIFWKIIMPLSKPIIIYTILTSFLGPWGDFMMSNYIVGRGSQDTWTVAVGMYNWISVANISYYWSRFCAAGVVVAIVPTVLFFFLQKFYVEGVTGGAVKG